mgnify:FL=1
MLSGDGAIPESGTVLTTVLPQLPRFGGGNALGAKERKVSASLTTFLDRYLGLGDLRPLNYPAVP